MSQAGHIKTLYIKNFYNYQGDNIVSLQQQPYNKSKWASKSSSESDKEGSLPTFIGSVGSGKTSIQNLISTTNILGYLASNNLDKVNELEIFKRESGASIFAAEVKSSFDKSAYFGIYSDANETSWNIQISGGIVSCSSVYALYPKEKLLVVISGNPAETKHYLLPDDFTDREDEVLKQIEKCFKEIKSLVETQQTAPYYFVSHDLSQLSNITNLKKELENLTTRDVKCAIFRSKSNIILHKKQKVAFRYMASLCRENNFQLILVLDSLDTISSVLNPVIRFWKSYDTVTHAHVLPETLLLESRHFGFVEVLTSSLVIFVEGESDKNFMEEIFYKLFDEGLRFKGECQLSWMKAIPPTIISTGGKDNIPTYVETLLKHAHLGLPHFVICDRDAAFPGSAGQNRSQGEPRRKTQKTETTILTKGRSSLLFKCIMYLHSENTDSPYYRLLRVHYDTLANRLGDIEIKKAVKTDPREYKHSPMQLSESAWKEVYSWYAELCNTECCFDDAQRVLEFCNKSLIVYPWACGALEEVIRDAGCDPPPKKELKDMELAFIVETIINNESSHLESLLSFIQLTAYAILSNLSGAMEADSN